MLAYNVLSCYIEDLVGPVGVRKCFALTIDAISLIEAEFKVCSSRLHNLNGEFNHS
jgi:hypothetical protein